MNNKNADYYFLKGGGEMGKLIRAKDWSKTSLGDPANWPQSLRTMVAVMLDNPFGMYIAWGSEYIQLYNDGYRPILGATKHPRALGISTQETFSEIWNIIESMFDGVMEGKAVGFPDFMLPLNRNGFVEECYFDFAYSPIKKENGEVGGVLVTVVETTEKKRATEALKESNARFINNIMQAPVAMCVFRGKNHVVEIANEKMLQLWGKHADQVMNKPIFEGLPEAKNQGLEELVDNVYTTGEKFVANERPVNLPRNGKVETTYVNFVYEALKEPDGTISGIIAIATEVTTQVEARKRIEESEIRFRSMVEQAPVAICVLRGENYVVEVANEKQLQLWGKTKEQVMNLPVFTAIPEAVGQGFEELLGGIFTTGKNFHSIESPIELIRNGKNERIYVNFTYEPLLNSNHIDGILSVAVEITEQVEIRQKIEKSEKQFNTLANNIQNLAWMADGEGYIFWYNQRWYDYTGTTLDEMKGWGWGKVHHPDHINRVVDFVKIAWQINQPFELTFPLRSANGEYRWFLTRAFPVSDEEGKISNWIGTNTDITEQKTFTEQLEIKVEERTAELKDKNMELEKLNKELQSFAYISSHDLQEPLRKIQTFATRIAEKEENNLSDNGKHMFNRMQEAAQRMQTLIQDLLSYSRTNNEERKFENTDLNKIVEEVREDLKEELKDKHATIEATGLCEAHIIPFQFRQLLHNLIGNSLKFSNPNNPPHIQIKSEIAKGLKLNNEKLSPENKYCHITVSDNGIGFEQQYSEKIFEVFQRLHGKNEYNGTGIGLSIVKKIVENHHGIITANGELNKGATFEIYILAI